MGKCELESPIMIMNTDDELTELNDFYLIKANPVIIFANIFFDL